MSDELKLTTTAGAPLGDNQNSITAEPHGPLAPSRAKAFAIAPADGALDAVQIFKFLVKGGDFRRSASGRQDLGWVRGREPNSDWVWRWVRHGDPNLGFTVGDEPLMRPAG